MESAFVFSTNILLAELFGTLLFGFLTAWVLAYAAPKRQSRNLYLSLGLGVSYFLSLMFNFVIVYGATTPAGPIIPLANNPAMLLTRWLAAGFNGPNNWGFMPILLVAQFVGAGIGLYAGHLSLKFAFRKDELINFFSQQPFLPKVRYGMMETIGLSTILLTFIGLLTIGGGLAPVPISIVFIGVVYFLVQIIFGQRYELNLNAALSVMTLPVVKFLYGKQAVPTIKNKIIFDFACVLFASVVVGITTGLIVTFSN